LKGLEEGKPRDAAEKTWGAMVRATKALILARKGVKLEGVNRAYQGILKAGKGRRK
jgi:hypothetical protein